MGVVRAVSHILLLGGGAGSGTESGSMMFGLVSTKEVAWLVANVSAEDVEGKSAAGTVSRFDGACGLR